MPYSTAAKNAMLNALGRNVAFQVAQLYASLHDGDPADTGANEISGGSPAYARKAINFNAAASGSMDSSNSPVFDVPAGKTVKYIGFWDAASSGTYYGSVAVTNEAFAGQGTYTVNSGSTFDLNS